MSQGGCPQTHVSSISSSVESRCSQSVLQYAAPSIPPVTVQLHSWYSQGCVYVFMRRLIPYGPAPNDCVEKLCGMIELSDVWPMPKFTACDGNASRSMLAVTCLVSWLYESRIS